MSKSLRDQLLDLALVDEVAVKRVEDQERLKAEVRAWEREARLNEARRLRDYKAAARERMLAGVGYTDLVVEYKRARES